MKKLLLVGVVAFAALQVGLVQAAAPVKSAPANHQKSNSFAHKEYAQVKKDAKRAWSKTRNETHKLYGKVKAKFHHKSAKKVA